MSELLMPFDSDHPEFTRGFECGQLWAALSLNPASHSTLLHSTNMEMAIRCASAKGYKVEITQTDNTWIDATFTKLETEAGIIDGGAQ